MIEILSFHTRPRLPNCFLTWGSGDQIQNFVIRVFIYKEKKEITIKEDITSLVKKFWSDDKESI